MIIVKLIDILKARPSYVTGRDITTGSTSLQYIWFNKKLNKYGMCLDGANALNSNLEGSRFESR
jgi:hypothetical protein